MKIFQLILARSILLALLSLTACQQRIPLQEGERIIFLGDSITELGDRSGGYVTLIRDSLAARYPDLEIEVIGAGINGNKEPVDLAEVSKQMYFDHVAEILEFGFPKTGYKSLLTIKTSDGMRQPMKGFKLMPNDEIRQSVRVNIDQLRCCVSFNPER